MSFVLSILVLLPATTAAPRFVSSRGGAMLSSLVLPGSGELLLGAKKRGEVMLWLDGIFWVSWAGFSWFRTSREQDARLIAKRYADADITITDRGYYRALEVYDNAEQFNEDIRREARELYPDDPDAQRRYYESRGYFGSAQWDWSSDSIRIYSYWRTRRAARTAGMNASFLAAALVLNRLVSFLDCLFFVSEPLGSGHSDRSAQAGAKHSGGIPFSFARGRPKLSSRIEFQPTQNQPGVALRYRF